MKPGNRNAIRMLCEGAVFVAMAHVLGYLKLFHMPQGGSVSLLMLPILLYAVRWGAKQGMLAGTVLGILQFMLDGGIAIGWLSILGDYVVACALIGLAGLFSARSAAGYYAALVLGCFGRWAAIVFTGATLWGAYMPEEFMGMVMTSPWLYSVLYNMKIAVSGLLSVVAGGLLYAAPPLRRQFVRQDLNGK